MDKTKLFSQTFKMLLGVMASVWVIYMMLIVFASDASECMAGTSRLVVVSAWLAGILSAPPLIYGLIKLLFYPNSAKTGKLSGWVLSIGAAIFISLVILLALAIAEYGCR